MRPLLTAACALIAGGAAAQDKKGTPVELAGMKSPTPAEWTEKPLPANSMRQVQFVVPMAEEDVEVVVFNPSASVAGAVAAWALSRQDAEVAVFKLRGAGSVEQNLVRQLSKFEPEGRKDRTDKVKVGPLVATYQDVSGNFKQRPFPTAQKFTLKKGWRQIYVIFDKGDDQYFIWLLGPPKTVEKNKAAFEDWLKNFK